MRNDVLIAGDTLDFVDSVPGFSAADGWVLTYVLVPRLGSSTVITLTGVQDGDTENHRIQVAAGTSAAWIAGAYSWFRYVERAGVRQSVGVGQLAIRADPASATPGYDNRTHARKVLDAIEAVLEGRASKDQEEYAIEGRSLKRTPLADLMAFRDKYRWEVGTEDAQERVAAGLPNPRRVGVRLSRG